MPTWVLPNLSDTTPAAPDGHSNGKWQDGAPYTGSDGMRRRDTSVYKPNTGGVSVKTGDYTLVAADCGNSSCSTAPRRTPSSFQIPSRS